MRLSISVARPNLVSLGTCFGKFTKGGKFKLHITALDYLAQYAKYKVSAVLCIDLRFNDRKRRFGLSRMAKCRSSTAITSSKPI